MVNEYEMVPLPSLGSLLVGVLVKVSPVIFAIPWRTWKHSLDVVVDCEPVKSVVSGVYTADQQ